MNVRLDGCDRCCKDSSELFGSVRPVARLLKLQDDTDDDVILDPIRIDPSITRRTWRRRRSVFDGVGRCSRPLTLDADGGGWRWTHGARGRGRG